VFQLEFTGEIKNSKCARLLKTIDNPYLLLQHYNLVIEVAMDDAMVSRAVINTVPDTKVS
jgi:pyruvate dehydrogenase E2 component (dihydrolipoamide acetyltransferase)